jgi:hypothetical protein
MATPPKLPRWATGAGADITEPTDSKKDVGWIGGATPDRPPAQHFNWLFNQVYQSLNWMFGLFFFAMFQQWNAAVNIGFADSPLSGTGKVLYAEWDDLFVVCGVDDGSDSFISSGVSAGSTWTLRITQTNGDTLRDIAHNGSNLWVVVGRDAGAPNEAIMFSASTASGTWTDHRATHASVNEGYASVCYDASSGRWIMGIENTDDIAYTTAPGTSPTVVDTTISAFTSSGVDSIACDGSQNVVAMSSSASTGAASKSANAGTAWSAVTLPWTPKQSTAMVAYNPVFDYFIVAGQDNTSGELKVAISTDQGTSWDEAVIDAIDADTVNSISVRDIQFGSRGDVVVCGSIGGSNPPFIIGSVDGFAWNNLQVPTEFAVASGSVLSITPQTKTVNPKDHFWVAMGYIPSDSTGDVMAYTGAGIF